MSFRLVTKSVTLNDLERRNGPYFVLFHRIRVASGAHCVKWLMTSSQKKFTFAISSPDEFIVVLSTFAQPFQMRFLQVQQLTTASRGPSTTAEPSAFTRTRSSADPNVESFLPMSVVVFKRRDGSRCHLVPRQASAQATLCQTRTLPPYKIRLSVTRLVLYGTNGHCVKRRPTNFLLNLNLNSKRRRFVIDASPSSGLVVVAVVPSLSSTSGPSIWQKGRIDAAHGRFNRIRQLAPMGTPSNTCLIGLTRSIYQTASRPVQPFLPRKLC